MDGFLACRVVGGNSKDFCAGENAWQLYGIHRKANRTKKKHLIFRRLSILLPPKHSLNNEELRLLSHTRQVKVHRHRMKGASTMNEGRTEWTERTERNENVLP
jgi:hypothetical protein